MGFSILTIRDGIKGGFLFFFIGVSFSESRLSDYHRFFFLIVYYSASFFCILTVVFL